MLYCIQCPARLCDLCMSGETCLPADPFVTLAFRPGQWQGNLSGDAGLFILLPLPQTGATLVPEGA